MPESALGRAEMLADARDTVFRALNRLDLKMANGNIQTRLRAGRMILELTARWTLLAGVRDERESEWVRAAALAELAEIQARIGEESE